jgi:AraC-like DNA-binding protein
MTRPKQRPATARRRILVVHEQARRPVPAIRALEAAHDLVSASGTRRAFAQLDSRGSRFDLVIVTCVARKGHRAYTAGVRFLKTVFKHSPWVPVLVIAHSQEAVRLRGDVLLSGVRTVLRHPTSGADLKRTVARLMPRIPARPPSPATVAAVKRIGAFLESHGTDRHTLVELARMASKSRSHFSHLFHSVLGMPLREYARTVRLERAYRLLVTSSLSLTAIAAEAGFYDLPHLDKAFRLRLGVTPLDFRLSHAAPRREPRSR